MKKFQRTQKKEPNISYLLQKVDFMLHRMDQRNGNKKSWSIKQLEAFQKQKKKLKERKWAAITNTPKLDKKTKNGLTTVTISKSQNELKGGK